MENYDVVKDVFKIKCSNVYGHTVSRQADVVYVKVVVKTHKCMNIAILCVVIYGNIRNIYLTI